MLIFMFFLGIFCTIIAIGLVVRYADPDVGKDEQEYL